MVVEGLTKKLENPEHKDEIVVDFVILALTASAISSTALSAMSDR